MEQLAAISDIHIDSPHITRRYSLHYQPQLWSKIIFTLSIVLNQQILSWGGYKPIAKMLLSFDSIQVGFIVTDEQA